VLLLSKTQNILINIPESLYIAGKVWCCMCVFRRIIEASFLFISCT